MQLSQSRAFRGMGLVSSEYADEHGTGSCMAANERCGRKVLR